MSKTKHPARELAATLAATAPLWRPAAFYDDPPWVIERPALADALLALGDDAVHALEHNSDALVAFLGEHDPALTALHELAYACLDHTPVAAPPDVAEVHGRDVPGRKWQQTLHFAAACGVPRGPVVDWCCGKAHLGRLLSWMHGSPVRGIEWNGTLCAAGNALAARDRLNVDVVHADALQTTAADAHLRADTHAVALHACGDLHVALLRTGADAGIAAFDIAPCCYHLTRNRQWQPLSQTLADSALGALHLTRDDLRLAVQETATASARVIRQTQQLAAWRLGFDRLQRHISGDDRALPTPSRPARVLREGFAAFCRDMAAHHDFGLPEGIDFAHWEALGRTQFDRMSRLQLLRHACRRPLEILLAADRASWLEERGYEVKLRTFCPRGLTPRNLLIRAWRDL